MELINQGLKPMVDNTLLTGKGRDMGLRELL